MWIPELITGLLVGLAGYVTFIVARPMEKSGPLLAPKQEPDYKRIYELEVELGMRARLDPTVPAERNEMVRPGNRRPVVIATQGPLRRYSLRPLCPCRTGAAA